MRKFLRLRIKRGIGFRPNNNALFDKVLDSYSVLSHHYNYYYTSVRKVDSHISDVAAKCSQVKIWQLVQFDKLTHLVKEMMALSATTLRTCKLGNCIISFREPGKFAALNPVSWNIISGQLSKKLREPVNNDQSRQ